MKPIKIENQTSHLLDHSQIIGSKTMQIMVIVHKEGPFPHIKKVRALPANPPTSWGLTYPPEWKMSNLQQKLSL